MIAHYDMIELRSRIRKQYGTEKAFAEIIGISPRMLRARLDGKTHWKWEEIFRISEIMDLTKEEQERYFFTKITGRELQIHRLFALVEHLPDAKISALLEQAAG